MNRDGRYDEPVPKYRPPLKTHVLTPSTFEMSLSLSRLPLSEVFFLCSDSISLFLLLFLCLCESLTFTDRIIVCVSVCTSVRTCTQSRDGTQDGTSSPTRWDGSGSTGNDTQRVVGVFGRTCGR